MPRVASGTSQGGAGTRQGATGLVRGFPGLVEGRGALSRGWRGPGRPSDRFPGEALVRSRAPDGSPAPPSGHIRFYRRR